MTGLLLTSQRGVPVSVMTSYSRLKSVAVGDHSKLHSVAVGDHLIPNMHIHFEKRAFTVAGQIAWKVYQLLSNLQHDHHHEILLK